MRVTVVCTGNVARSPALALLLKQMRPDLEVASAAVGSKAVAGRRMSRQMRLLLESVNLEQEAHEHRSRLYQPGEAAGGLVVCCARVHVQKLAALDPDAPHQLCSPHIADPAFGGAAAYRETFPLIMRHAERLASELPRQP